MGGDRIREMRAQIAGLSDEELRQLSLVVRSEFESRMALKASEFRRGDRVEFDHDGQVVSGRVVKIARKTVTVHVCADHEDQEHGHGPSTWRVSPGLLRRSASVEEDKPHGR
jgi:hypothetical protein